MKTYNVIVKDENSILEGNSLNFYFENLNDALEFCKEILLISKYHIEILQCGEDNE